VGASNGHQGTTVGKGVGPGHDRSHTTAPALEPAGALRRIAYLLEAEGAETYKVRAFRRAAASVERVSLDELGRLDNESRLGELPGIGKTTAAAVHEVLGGEAPAYLRELEERAPRLAAGPALDLLVALRGDCHSHSDWSDGGGPIEEMAEAASDVGHEYLALTDHSPRLTVARGLSPERLERQLDEVARLNESLAPFRLLTGIEVDILDDGSLDQEERLLSRLDVVVASVHSSLRMPRVEMTRRMLNAVRNPNVSVLGHCTGRRILGRPRPQSDFDAEAVFAACKEAGTVEINSRPDRLDPPEDLLKLAKSIGCTFSIDSDAHAPGQLSWLRHGCEMAAAAGIGPEAVANTRPLPEFLAWAREGRARRAEI
jgi:putative hydrolase